MYNFTLTIAQPQDTLEWNPQSDWIGVTKSEWISPQCVLGLCNSWGEVVHESGPNPMGHTPMCLGVVQ
jgi:hypothetical protein